MYSVCLLWEPGRESAVWFVASGLQLSMKGETEGEEEHPRVVREQAFVLHCLSLRLPS